MTGRQYEHAALGWKRFYGDKLAAHRILKNRQSATADEVAWALRMKNIHQPTSCACKYCKRQRKMAS